MRNKSEAEVEPETLTLKCPSCDNDDPSCFEHWEQVDCSRRVYGFDDHGQLEIGDCDYGDSENDRLYCQKCSHTFPVPIDIEISWV